MGIKTRIFRDKNYRSVYFNGKTLRFSIDPKKEILELDYPEFYDVKITNKCQGGCSYCYMDSCSSDEHYDTNKLFKFFNSLDDNQKPYQLAIGGGEPTSHPHFYSIMSRIRAIGISPNYTTNGMFIRNKERAHNILEATINFCEGVAISCHRHLEDYWKKSAELYLENNVFLNFHLMIEDKKSIDYFLKIYKEYRGKIKYFVLLPVIEQGRAKNVNQEFDYLFEEIKNLGDISDIAFGAKFYDRLKTESINVSLYEPEIMSKYIDLKDGAIYKSSFDTGEPIGYI